MRKGFRWISAALTVTLLYTVLILPAAGWQDVSAYIPDTIEKLDLPQTESGASSSGHVFQVTNYPEGWDYDDPFLTGMSNWEVTLVWEDMVLGSGKDGKVMPQYVRKIIATYPENYYIRQIEAEYGNDGRRSLVRYTIIYRFSDAGQYAFSYDGNTDEIQEGFYTDGSVRLMTGTGDHADTWYSYDIMNILIFEPHFFL